MRQKFIIAPLIILFGLFLSLSAQAAESDPAIADEAINDETVNTQSLGVSEPKILPGNPFYFLKEWSRGIKSALTFDKVKKTEIKEKIANERLVELKTLVEKGKNPEIIKKASEKYQNELEKIKVAAEKIKEKASQNPEVNKFLEKFAAQQLLHQKVLEKLEDQVKPEVLQNIKELREQHLEKFGQVMAKLADNGEKIGEIIENKLLEQEGSKFKNFKNLEILRKIEEKVPEQAKEAIRKAQENSLKRLGGDLEKMSPEDQEKFNEYIKNIQGDKEKHLEILENLKSVLQTEIDNDLSPELKERREILKEKLEKGTFRVIEKIEEKIKPNCALWEKPAPDFCKGGRIVILKDEKGCPLQPKCVYPAEVNCETLSKCKEGYILYDTGIKNRYGCPIKKCVKEGELGEKPSEEKPSACLTFWDPVCGKNGKTYSNECFAKQAEADIIHKGICKEVGGEKPECKVDSDCPQQKCPANIKCIGGRTKCVNGKCVETTVEPIENRCQNLYWFDKESKECGYKKFCGAFMYLGLRTFDTKEICAKELLRLKQKIQTQSDTKINTSQ